VYPAAGLIDYAPGYIPKFIVDKKIPHTISVTNLVAIEKSAAEGMKDVAELLRNLS
jgi:hypothetical protein